MESIVAIACAPVGDTNIDWTADTYRTSGAVISAAFYGHCTYEDASLELNRRMEAATDAVAVQKIASLASINMDKNSVETNDAS